MVIYYILDLHMYTISVFRLAILFSLFLLVIFNVVDLKFRLMKFLVFLDHLCNCVSFLFSDPVIFLLWHCHLFFIVQFALPTV
jgi:hypothetical protein